MTANLESKEVYQSKVVCAMPVPLILLLNSFYNTHHQQSGVEAELCLLFAPKAPIPLRNPDKKQSPAFAG
jgi:hypothetical protein